jgi:hypothetical protein
MFKRGRAKPGRLNRVAHFKSSSIAPRAERLEPRWFLSAPAVNFIEGAGYAAAGFTPTDVATGKFNNDNFPDLVVGGNNQARILLGDGRGGFALGSTLNTGFNVGAVAAGDLNNDGISDIVLNKLGASDIRIYLGNSNGTVHAPSGGGATTVPDPVSDIAIADIDGDGKMDFVFAGITSRVVWGNGDGTLGAGVNLTANPSWHDVVVTTADLNKDGRMDVITAGTDGAFNPVHISYSEPGRTLAYENQGYRFDGIITDVAAGDFTGDTIPDIAVTFNDATSHGRIVVMVNTGLGHSFTSKTLAFGQTTPFKSLAVADYDKDKKLDIAVGLNSAGSAFPDSFLMMGGVGDGSIDSAILSISSGPGNPIEVLAADFNADGWPDVATLSDSGRIGTVVSPTASGLLYDDANENGVQDAGEAGIAGRTVFEDLNNNGLPDPGETTSITDASGTFHFAFPVGTHVVRPVLAGNDTQTFPTGAPGFPRPSVNITITSGSVNNTARFGIYSGGTISGKVWNDFNANGVFDQYESALAGRTVYIDTNNSAGPDPGEPIAVTNPLGDYRFFLPAGTYRVREEPPASWYPTPPFTGYLITASPQSPATNVNLGQTQLGGISGRVFYDNVADGISDDGDPGKSGFKVFIDNNFNGAYDATDPFTFTDATGHYSFANLFPGSYAVGVVKPAGWVQTTPLTTLGDFQTRVAGGGGDTGGYVDFGVIYPSYVIGRVFNDLNGDGFQTAGENGLAGFSVFVDVSGTGYGSFTDPATQTDAQGNYTLRVPVDGTYNVRVSRPSGWQSTVPSSNSYSVVFSNGSTVNGKTFGLKQGAFNNAGFKDPVNYAASQFDFVNPASVTTGDFNLDKNQDFAVANNSGDVTLFLGNGLGTFTRSSIGFGGSGKRSIITAFVNADNIPDLITANQEDGTVSIFLGNGNGTFQNSVDYTAAPGAYCVVASDFTGDNKIDLAVGGISATQVVLLVGNGLGAFAAPVNIGASSGTYAIAAGDFDKDNKKDLAWVNQNSNSVVIIRGNGNGTFQSPLTLTAGINQPGSIAIGDFNKDTFPDLAVLNQFSDIVRIITGVGNGTFNSGVDYGTGSTPAQVTTLDVDGDGWTDLAIAYKSDGTTDISGGINILRNHGDGTFEPALTSTAHTSPNSVAVADFNNDLLPDLVATNFYGDDVSVMLNNRSAATTISGTVFNDLNASGAKDAGEGFLAGQVVYLDLDNNSVQTAGEPTATTDASGNFLFTSVLPGQYVVRIAPDPGYAQTLPAANAGINVQATPGGAAVLSFGLHDVAPPEVFDGQFTPNAPAMNVQLVFTENVSPSPTVSDFQLLNRNTGATIASASLSLAYNASTQIASLTFPGFTHGQLPDGNYRLTLPAGAVADASGNALAAPYTFDFSVLAGDANNDGVIGFADLVAVAQNYGATANTSFAKGDYNYDGQVSFADLVIVAQKYGSTLPPPLAAAPVPAPLSPKPAAIKPLPLTPSSKSLFSATPIVKAKSVVRPMHR